MITTMPAGRWALRHLTGTARSGPPPDRPTSPAPPPPPAWRNWLLIVGLLLTAALFLLPVPTAGKVEQLSYSQLKSDIAAGEVKSVALGPDGGISGTLTNGTKFSSSYPTSLQDPQFAQLLDQHNVQVTTKSAQTSIGSVLLSLLPLLVFVAIFIYLGRARPAGSWPGWVGLVGRGPRCSMLSGRRRPLLMWLAMRGLSGR